MARAACGRRRCGPSARPRRGQQGIDVGDRGADLFELLAYQQAQQRGYVVGSNHNRVVTVAAEDPPRWLPERLRPVEASAWWDVTVSAGSRQAARTAHVAACDAYVLPPPHHRHGEYADASLPLWGIGVWEEQPPPGVEALEWIVLTNVPVVPVEQLRQRLDWYGRRGLIAEYHKGQKTGAGIEQLPLQSRAGREPKIARLSVVAVALVNVRVAARLAEAAARAATELVEPVWVEVLSVWRDGQGRVLRVREFTRALARRGGHQKRKGDGLPGWQTLWRGWNQLHAMISYELSRQKCGIH